MLLQMFISPFNCQHLNFYSERNPSEDKSEMPNIDDVYFERPLDCSIDGIFASVSASVIFGIAPLDEEFKIIFAEKAIGLQKASGELLTLVLSALQATCI